MAGRKHRSGDTGKPARPDKESVRLALTEGVEVLFREFMGEPQQVRAASWRPKSNTSLDVKMRGEKRGLWHDFASGEGGDLFDLVAIHLCGLSRAKDDFPTVLDAAARWAGISAQEVDRTELERRQEERRQKAVREEDKEAARKANTVAGILARAVPVEGTSAAVYLRSRGIEAWPDDALAYLPGDPGALVVWAKDATGRIVAGQRIYVTQAGERAIDPDGSKLTKKSFGSIQGFPARLTGAGDRLYVVEGPETALSVWAATGAEVWAVFGWTGFKAAPVPVDRPVTFCPDQDAPNKPAAVGFKDAVAHHLDRGVDLWVAAAPEPEGSKADLNDTHQRAGLEAVREALAAAYKPLRAKPHAGPNLRDAEALPDVLEVGEARRRLQAEIRAGLSRQGITLIEATLGLGKTHTMIAEVVKLLAEAKEAGIESPAVVIAAPMHRLGRQLLADIRAAAPGIRVVQLYGAEAQDPDDPSQTVCKRLDEYRERGALLLDLGSFCAACSFAASCLHHTGKAEKADIYVASHERLKASKTPLKEGQTLLATVVDENPINALLNASRRPVPLCTLKNDPARIRTKEGEMKRLEAEADLRAFRNRLYSTLAGHGPGYLRLSALSGWTVADTEAAASLEWMRKIKNEDDPEVRGNKTITVLTRIYAEIARSIEGQIEENGRLQIRDGEMGLECLLNDLKPIGEAFRKAPVLMLDATAKPEVMERLAGEPLAHHATIRARENLLIEQDPNWSGAKSKFKDTGNFARVRRFSELQAFGSNTATIGNKDIIRDMGLPGHIETAHFNALRGLNEFAQVETLVIVGRPQPDEESLSRMVGALFGTPCVRKINPDGKAWRRVLQDGRVMEAETKAATHADPRAQLLLSLIRDAEVAQAIGRLRGVNRPDVPALCVLLSDAVVEYPVKLVKLRPTLWACDIVGEMLERGVAFLSGSQAAAAYPDLYKDRQALDQRIARLPDMTTLSIKDLYGKRCHVVTVKRPRGAPSVAIVPPSVVDVEQAIKAVLPDAKIIDIRRPERGPDLKAADAAPAPAAALVLDLRQARNDRADQMVDAAFQKAIDKADQLRKARREAADGSPARKVVGGGIVAHPARCLLWIKDARPKALPLALRRYAVEGDVVRLVHDAAARAVLRERMEWQQARLREWLSQEPDEADYWR